MFAIPLLAAVIAAVFAGVVLQQFGRRGHMHQLYWGSALAMFALAAAFETFGAAHGWTATSYRGYYLFGGVLNVGWLGVGSVQLISPRRVGPVAAIVMLILSVAAIPAVIVSHVDASLLSAAVPGRGAIAAPAIIFAPVTNILGTVALVGGAAWSAWRAWRRGAPPGLVLGLVILAAGAFVVAGTHSYAQTAGVYAIQPVGEAIGIVGMFVGYLVIEAQRQPAARASRPEAS